MPRAKLTFIANAPSQLTEAGFVAANRMGWDITTLYTEVAEAGRIDPEIRASINHEVSSVEAAHFLARSISRLWELRKVFRNTDVAILNGHGTLMLRLLFIVGIAHNRPWILRIDTVISRRATRQWLNKLVYSIWRLAGNHFAATSQRSSEYLADCLGVPRERIHLMPYLPSPKVRPGLEPCQRPPVALVACKLNSREQPNVAIESAVQAASSVAGSVIIVAGEGPQGPGLRKKYQDSNVKFIGWLPYEEYLELMRRARVYVHTPDFEPWGASIPEAICSGTPFVATPNCISAAELLALPEVRGAVSASPEELTAAIRKFLKTPEGRGSTNLNVSKYLTSHWIRAISAVAQ